MGVTEQTPAAEAMGEVRSKPLTQAAGAGAEPAVVLCVGPEP